MHALFEYTPGRKNHILDITVDAGYNNSGTTSFFQYAFLELFGLYSFFNLRQSAQSADIRISKRKFKV
jgi:hypothetical protein